MDTTFTGEPTRAEKTTPRLATLGAGTTNWTDNSVVMGQTYYYVVTAVGCDESESAMMNVNEAFAMAGPTP